MTRMVQPRPAALAHDHHPERPELPGFRLGTELYRQSYGLSSAVDALIERIFGIREPGLRRAQERLANWIGDRRFRLRRTPLVRAEQRAEVGARLRPGDLILTRHEGYLSNLAMPGFWKHALIYVGTPDERRAVFDDPAVRAWAQSQGAPDLETLLARHHGPAHAQCGAQGGPAVLSADGRGVGFDALDPVLRVDALAVLRPRMAPVALAQAFDTAFGFVGFPYDFLFDFACDQSFICSEVIYKAFHRGPMHGGLALRTRNIAGCASMPTNDLAQLYAERRGTPEQDLELVVFLDGDERAGEAVEAPEPAFATSWKRSAWEGARGPLPAALPVPWRRAA